MHKLFRNSWYWLLDYSYVVTHQLKSFFDHSHPSQYRQKSTTSIILIPGIYENWKFMKPIAKLLYAEGHDIHIIDGLGYNRGTVEAMAQVVSDYIASHHLNDVTLVTHSKGGLIGKYLLSVHNQSNVVNGLVALNAPFSGSRYAAIFPLKSLRIFVPTSEILMTLGNNKLVNRLIVSIYGRFDPHIPGGSHLEGAHNIELDTYGHFRIISDPAIHAAIVASVRRFIKD